MVAISKLEPSETVMRELAGVVRERHGPAAYEPWLDALTAAAAARIGIEVPLSPGSRTDVGWEELIREVEGDVEAALEDPHALGWFHQHFGEADRDASHRAHNRREEKHDTPAVTTQLYTPRWIADLLAEEAIERTRTKEPDVLDPAVGGGQMLLAAYDALHRRHPEAAVEDRVARLRGLDIDARAVTVARRSLKLHVARREGARQPAAEEIIDGAIAVGDGLFDEVDGADVVLTNPPYMGLRSMPRELKERIRQRYEPFHRDLFAAFIRRCLDLATERIGILAQQTIWYLKSYRRARRALLDGGDLELFVHLGPHAFRALDGEKANVVAFVEAAGPGESSSPGTFWDLRDLGDPGEMRGILAGEAPRGERRTERETGAFGVIPGAPLAYWLPEPLLRKFDGGRRLGDIADVPGCQNKTGDNRTYVRDILGEDIARERTWLEPLAADPDAAPMRRAPSGDVRWIPYSKGGRYAPWWGNWQHVVDWSGEARAFYDENATSNLLPERYRFRQGICYTDFGGDTFNARWMPPGVLFDMAGPAIFPDLEGVEYPRRRIFALLGLLNTAPVRQLLNALNPSIHYQVTDLRRLPVPEWSDRIEARLAELAVANVRDVRRGAARVDCSPVRPGVLSGGGADPSEVAARCRERERTIEEIALELYELDPEDVEPVGAEHHYFAK